MDYMSAFVYGIIQGITEFLPVSSSGHLAILPSILDIKDPGVYFDLAMHLGTAFAVMTYFRKDILKLIGGFFSLFKFKKSSNINKYFALNMIISTVATVILVKSGLEVASLSFGRGIGLIAFNLIFFGIIMFIADKMCKEKIVNSEMKKTMQLKRALLIGSLQALSIFPGVSRSGITLTVSRILGLSRRDASSYSFLLSLPIIIGGFILKSKELFNNNSGAFDLSICLFSIFIAFIFGLATIHFFLKVIEKLGLGIFSLYRCVLGAVLLFYFF